jgi:hypothetical protein
MSEKKNFNCADIGSFFKKHPELKQMFESCMSKGDFKCDCQKMMGSMMKNCCGSSGETKPAGSV